MSKTNAVCPIRSHDCQAGPVVSKAIKWLCISRLAWCAERLKAYEEPRNSEPARASKKFNSIIRKHKRLDYPAPPRVVFNFQTSKNFDHSFESAKLS